MWPLSLWAKCSQRVARSRTLRFDILEDRALLSISMKGAPIDLGSLVGPAAEAYGINDNGQVVGKSASADGYWHAFSYDGTMHDLGTLGATASWANCINNNGRVVGELFGPSRAFLYDGTMHDLGTLPGDSGSEALGINDKGEVVGASWSDVNRAFFYADGTMRDLGTLPGGRESTATSINNNGHVVGYGDNASELDHAFLYDGTTMHDLGTLGGLESAAASINNNGHVVGWAQTATGDTHAFRYDATTHIMTDLGTLPDGDESMAKGINDKGQVVGYANIADSSSVAFVTDGTTLVNLNHLLPANTGWILQSATAINNQGQIVGYGIHNFLSRAFVWSIAQAEADTSTTVVASATQSNFGEQVTFTATVTAKQPGLGTPTGSVTFNDAFGSVTATLGTATLSTSGGVTTATFTTSSLDVGSHSITVTYHGDAIFNPSTSSVVTENVASAHLATTTALSSSASPAVFGQQVTFTATVSASSPNSPAPRGLVTFMDGKKILGSVGLSTRGGVIMEGLPIDLGTLPGTTVSIAEGISANGEVVGQAATATGVPHAFLYDQAGMHDLGTLPGGRDSAATSINNHGQVVGYAHNADGLEHAFLYDGTTMRDLGTLPGGEISAAHGINDKGQVVGWSYRAYPGFYDAFLYDGTMHDLGTLPGGKLSEAHGINDKGEVVGAALTPVADFHAFRCDGTTQSMVDLGTLPGGDMSWANRINDQGHVVGKALTATRASHAFLYDGTMHDLGTLPGGKLSEALGINDKGQMVGYSNTPYSSSEAVLWIGTKMIDLNDLLPSGSGWYLGSATAINNQGQIVGWGFHEDQQRAFLWSIAEVAPSTGTTVVTSPAQATATFSTSSLAVGSHAIKAYYSGDVAFKHSASNVVKESVSKAATSTTLLASVNPSVSGQKLTFTATVSASAPASGSPTGQVTFMDGKKKLGTGTLITAGGVTTATFTTGSLGAGSHSIKAVYPGDKNFRGSPSNVVSQTVNKAETGTTLRASFNPSPFGQKVMFTATVSVSAPGAGAPTGRVTFQDGSTTLGTGTLRTAKGVTTAAFSTSKLGAGSHTITASYAGDGRFHGSASTLAQTVGGVVTVDPLVTNNSRPRLTGAVSPAWLKRGLAGVTVAVGGQTLAATISGGKWSATLPTALPDGTYDVQAAVKDKTGKTESDLSVNELIVDRQTPAVTVAPLVTNNPRATLSGTWSDPSPSSGIAALTIVVAGQTLTPTLNGNTWSAPAPAGLTEGTHSVQATITDRAGNRSTDATSNELTVDLTRPTVSINQAADQADPADTWPIRFLVTFSEPVVDFTPNDVVFGGVASTATLTPLGTDGKRYEVAVSDIAGLGTLTASIAAESVHDAAGNSSLASTSTDNRVAFDMRPVLADPDLEQAVREELRLAPGTPVGRSWLSRLTTLSADSNLIDSLDGLQHATHLQSLKLWPADWSAAPAALGGAGPLAPLAGLTQLGDVSLARAGLSNSEIDVLAGLPGLQTLDLRYNEITDLAALAPAVGLQSLLLYGNPIADFTALKGRLVDLDLRPGDPEKAETVAQLAAALGYSPVRMYEYVCNNFQYEGYAGWLKGTQATLETRAGNDWDQAALLIGLLNEAGVTARIVTGRIDVEPGPLTSWIGGVDARAAAEILNRAYQNPVTYVNEDNSVAFVRFDHTWVEANLPAGGSQWLSMDPSFKFKDYRQGVPDIIDLVPFDEADYFSRVRSELPIEYYQRQVTEYLAANRPGVSITEVGYDGPIVQRAFDAIPSSLPYTVDTVNDRYDLAAVPESWKHKVALSLRNYGTPLIQYTFVLPETSLKRITVSYAGAGAEVTPELRIDGQVVATAPAVARNSSMEIALTAIGPNDVGSHESTNGHRAGQYLAVGAHALQMSDGMLDRQIAAVNQAAIARKNGEAVALDDEVGAALFLALVDYYHQDHRENVALANLTQFSTRLYVAETGFAVSEPTVQYHWDLTRPAVPDGLFIDLPGSIWPQAASISGDNAARPAVLSLSGYNGSAMEHAIWERMYNVESMSTVKSLGLAHERDIPVFVIDSSNAATYIPQLTLSAGIVSAIQGFINQGATVTVPRDPTPLNNWSGVGYVAALPNSTAYMISGGLNGQEISTLRGGYGTGFPIIFIVPIGNENTQQGYAGDPVNVANGNVTRDETDLTLLGIGVPLSFARHYDSQSTIDSGMGIGWSYSDSDFLSFQPDGSIDWKNDAGNRFRFTPIAGGGYATPDSLHGTFTAISDGYQFRDKYGLVHEFDAGGKLTQIRDRNGNGLTLTYTAGRLATVSQLAATTRTLNFTWTNGHITAVTDFTGRQWTYAYSGDRLTSVTSPSDATTSVAVVRYDYYPDSDLALGGLLRQITEADGATTTYSYYPNRTAFQVTDAEGNRQTLRYDFFRNRTAWADERKNVTLYDFDSEGHTIALTHPDGSRESYVWQNSLMQSSTDTFGLPETYEYDVQGNLIRQTERSGAVTQFSFEPTFSRMTSSTRPGERTTTFAYDANGNLTEITDALGNRTTMTYDGRGQMLSLTRPKGNLTPAPGDYTATFTYNDAGQVLTQSSDLPATVSYTYDALGNRLTLTDANGNTTRNKYDLLGRLTKTTDPLSHDQTFVYDTRGRLLSTTDAQGNTVTNEFDLKGNLVRSINPDGTFVCFAYDPHGNMAMQTDALGLATQFVYDSRDQQIQTTYADGTVTRQRYDSENRLSVVVDTLDNKTVSTYDATGRLLTTTDALGQTSRRTYDAVGNLVSITDRRGGVTTYAYDLLNRRTAITDALNQTTTTVYDANGNVVSVTDPLSHTTSYAYDILDRRTSTTDALGQVTTRTYDPVGSVLSITDPLGRTVRHSYDALNRPVSVTDPLDNTTTTAYDAVGNVTSATDALGHSTSYSYDALNRQISSTDALGQITTWTYDPVGNLLSLTDPVGNTTSYAYDQLNRVVSETNAMGEGRTYAYDAVGNLTTYIDRNGRTTRSTYDALDRRTSEEWLDGSGTPVRTVRYSYDAAGQMTGAGDPDSSYAYTYDLAGRLATVDNRGTPGVPNVVLSYAYDAAGNTILAADLIDGTARGTETMGYDALNRLTQITQTGSGVADKRIDLSYSSASELTGLSRYADRTGTTLVAASAYTYDLAGRLTQLSHSRGATTLAQYQCAFDAADRVTQETSADGTRAYTYDDTNQLTFAANSSQPNESYSYDANGNRTGSGRVTGKDNRLLSDSTYEYGYDAEGNLIRRTEIAAGNVMEYTWDYRNRLTRVLFKSASGAVIGESDYTYDVNDRRIAKSVDADGPGPKPAVVQRFVYDQNHLALQFDASGTQTHRYLYGSVVDRVLADETAAGDLTWLLSDHQGTVRDLIDSSGANLDHVSYDAFGLIVAETNPAAAPLFAYTGQPLDRETGLQYHRARYYDPSMGRFLNQDPLSISAGDANLYRYAGNNVTNLTDPSGKSPERVTEMRAVDPSEQISLYEWSPRTAGGSWLYRFNDWLKRHVDRAMEFWRIRDLREYAMGERNSEPPRNPGLFRPQIETLDKILEEGVVDSLRKVVYTQDMSAAQSVDSSLHAPIYRWQVFEYEGVKLYGNELNYYTQGIMWKGLGYSKTSMKTIIYGWKAVSWQTMPTSREIWAAGRGYDDYPKWIQKYPQYKPPPPREVRRPQWEEGYGAGRGSIQ